MVFSVFLWAKSLPIPDFQTFDERKIVQSTKIFDRTGENLLYDIHENIKRTVIPYSDMPIYIKNATVAIEDSNFYQHRGISIVGIMRAFFINLTEGRVRGQGGSTITQQLVKNTFLTTEKTFTRKIKEVFLSLKLETIFSKEEILALYLNEIPYGGSNYGVEAASESFFGKDAKDLNLAESAYLAALPQAPTYFSPYGAHKDALDERKDTVLRRMLELGFIEEKEYESTKNIEVKFINQSEVGIRAPHFVMYIKNYLEEKYGKDFVEQGGLNVITTIDLELQEETENMAKEYSKEIEEKFNAKNLGLIGIDPKTGQILVMVGSRNYFDKEYEGNFNITLAKRQPGSSFKPFVYTTLFQKGYLPETVVFDLETEFNSSCNPDGAPKPGTDEEECYMPGNYDNIFRGPVSLRNALAQSINIPAVKVLYLTGLMDSLETASKLGITTLTDSNRYGLTLVLGGGEVTLLEMTGAYSVFANNGIKNNTTGILEIKDGTGKIIEKFEYNPTRVLEPQQTAMINSILSDNDARTPAFGEQSWLYFPGREVAAKTGTTNDYRDAWVVGYTPSFSLGLWVGNNDNTPMEKRVAGFIAAPLWNSVLKKVFEKIPNEKFPEIKQQTQQTNIPPIVRGLWQGGEIYFTDKISKKLATEFTPQELTEENVLTQIHSILYWVDEDHENNSQFPMWEYSVRKWVEEQDIKEETIEDIPTEYDDIHKPEYKPEINIVSPTQNSIFKKTDSVRVKIEGRSHFPLSQIDFYINDNYLGSIKPPINDFVFNISETSLVNKNTQLKLVVYDSVQNKNNYIVNLFFE